MCGLSVFQVWCCAFIERVNVRKVCSQEILYIFFRGGGGLEEGVLFFHLFGPIELI